MSSAATIDATSDPVARRGHPGGLYVLFGAEMWERFSYYGMRALLVLYLVNYLKWDRPGALDLYGTYTGMVYLTPMLGGFLADRYLGQRKSILIGGIVMALGHFAMAFESLLYFALAMIVLGNGFFKPNISTMVGQLYPQGDARRDGAYTIFYMGINLGAFLAPLVCGALGERVGWHYGFSAAGVGMVFGLVVFASLQKALGSEGYPPSKGAKRTALNATDWVDIVMISAVCAGAAWVAVKVAPAIQKSAGSLVVLCYWTAIAVAIGLIASVIVKLGRRDVAAPLETDASSGLAMRDDDPNRPFTSIDYQRIGVVIIVAIFSILFWMGFEQAGGTFSLFADKKTDRVLFNNEFPASWYQSINPMLIFLLAPIFSILWTALDRTRFKLSSAAKMGVGLVLLGIGFTFMLRADRLSEVGKVGPQWLAIVYLFNTLGELCLSPIGLSLVNKLSHARVASLMMAVWFLCTAIANKLAAAMESMLEGSNINLYFLLILTSVIPGLILLALTPLLRRMAHGRL